MILANAWQTQRSGHYHRTTNANLGVQASYNYQHKYYADFSVAMPYSTKLPTGNRVAFSPTVTLGWNLANEKFLENSIFDNLMLTASVGIINQDLDITASDNEVIKRISFLFITFPFCNFYFIKYLLYFNILYFKFEVFL